MVKKYAYHGHRYNSMAALAKVEKIDVRRIARAVKNHEKLDDLRPLGPIINVSPVRARINKRHED